MLNLAYRHLVVYTVRIPLKGAATSEGTED